MQVEVVLTDELGDRSYIAHDGEVALIVDPQRDIDRVEAVLADRGLHCVLVAETHVHNDYVSGGLELARRTGATYVVAATDDVAFDRRGVSDGDELEAGRLRITVVTTPGHTDGHLAYVVGDGEGAPVVFTGGSLLYGSVGRTDLVDPDRTDELTRAQYHSARHLADLLADDVAVYPTHGFGSFCSSGSSTSDTESTIGVERGRNDALVAEDEDAFVARLVAGLTAVPSYYAHMAPRNQGGAGPIDLSPPAHTDPVELARRIGSGEWVVDLRSETAFAAEHVAGTVGIGLGQHFATYLGWLIPWETPLTLIAETAEQISQAQRQLVRIGIDRPSGAAIGSPMDLAEGNELRSYPTATFDVSVPRIPSTLCSWTLMPWDRSLTLGRRRLETVLAQYVEPYNSPRPPRFRSQRTPSASDTVPAPIGDVDSPGYEEPIGWVGSSTSTGWLPELGG